MKHSILSWNVRGLGGRDKHPSIKDCIRKAKGSVVIIQETKLETISGRLVNDIWGIPSVSWEVLPSVGASGGVCIMWDTSKVQVYEASRADFSVSILCQFKGETLRKVVTGVYGPCDRTKRDSFWKELEEIRAYTNGRPWCIGGDFNVIHYQDERNGRGTNEAGMRAFDEFISRDGLVDLPLKGGGILGPTIRRCLFFLGWTVSLLMWNGRKSGRGSARPLSPVWVLITIQSFWRVILKGAGLLRLDLN